MTLLSIVVPVFHNAPSLPDLYTRFAEIAERNPDDTFEFIFVDDGSKDNSFAVLSDLAAADSRTRIVKLSRNFGSNAAILAGLSHARGDAVAAIAADLQDPPELIHEMIGHWREGRKVILAAREGRDDPGLTSIMADIFYGLFRRFAIKTMPQRGFDFFLIDRQLVDHVKAIQENNAYLMGLILWLGFDPLVIYYNRRAREKKYGQSMWTLAKKLKYFVDSFVAFSYVPVRAASLIGISLSVLGLLYAVFVIITRMIRGIPVEGWTSLMVVLLIVSGAQMIMIGILGEYLWRNLDETRKRPRFIVERVIEGEEARHEALSKGRGTTEHQP
ncbi:MAG TPA: glycosyltransferase family 2 protein [Aggregatilineales bacterium]|nr:glycosyltransferase [Anaerolineales bacterium]HRE48846.1 glycosyltransferase family 2 protein [Aggregatilineales bacterium]